MLPLGSLSLGWLRARHDPARRLVSRGLLALFCLAMAVPIEAPAQTASPEIAEIQRRLADLGYDAGAADGLLGPQTRAALGAFQADQGLSATGRPDAETRRALFGTAPSRTAADGRAPTDDPPRLDAVPMTPVQVAPLAPLAGSNPHKGIPPPTSPADRQGETRPVVRKDRGWTLSQADRTAESARGDHRLLWAAGALLTGAVMTLVVARRGRTARAERASDGSSRPVAAAGAAIPTTVGGGHVFGVDVPADLREGSGKDGAGGL
jgi:Putative peptidoglycan binding domain